MRRVAAYAICAGCHFDPGVLPSIDASQIDARSIDAPERSIDAAPTETVMFIADYTAGSVHRYTVTHDVLMPAPTMTLALPGALSPMVLPQTGELLVSQLSMARIDRFTTPLVTPTANGSITGQGVSPQHAKMAIVDDQLWVVASYDSRVLRLAINSAGTATMAGQFAVANGRGIVFDRVRRQLWVSQCCGTNTILTFDVGPGGSLTARPSITTGGLDNPHSMVLMPWGELFVANAGNASIVRYTLDTQGVATPNGSITGNGMSVPIDFVLAPWGELFVSNLGTGTVSRFDFNATHLPIPRGTFAVPAVQTIAYMASGS